MLSVSPPLHQDFRSSQMLCSPGDGWRAYVPPPPPVLPSAFHFLAPLLLPDAYPTRSFSSNLSTIRTPQIPLDKRLYGKLEKVFQQCPVEILQDMIGKCVEQGSGKDLILVSKRMNELTIPTFYKKIVLRTRENISSLIETLKRKPELSLCIRELTFELHRLPWEEVKELMGLMGGKEGGKKYLNKFTIQIPASDLHLAISIFQKTLMPKQFIWKTSPCWQLKPLRNQFLQFFQNWSTCLEFLQLENFHFDDQTLIDCLEALPHLRKLSLCGRGSEYISSKILFGLVTCQRVSPSSSTEINKESQQIPFSIEIANCSLVKQTSLKEELDQSISRSISWL